LNNAKKIVHVIQYELHHLIERRITALLLAGYALLSLFISAFDSLREAYFNSFDFVALELANFILPVFLLINIILVLSPAFAGEIENHTEEIPSTCLYGRRIRCICKLYATLLFVILLNAAYHLITCIIVLSTQPLWMWEKNIAGISGDIVFDFCWSGKAHYLFAAFSLLMGSIVTAVLTLSISCISKAAMTVCAVMSFISIVEYMFNRFSFWKFLQQYNIWQLLNPYKLVLNVPFNSLSANFASIAGFFAVVCAISVWNILKKGS
jgi:hypothetical protein